MSNYDNIKNMTIEEMASFLQIMCPHGFNEMMTCEKDLDCCVDCWMDWLKQEVSE